MAGLAPAIHVRIKAWMPATSAGMTDRRVSDAQYFLTDVEMRDIRSAC
jgi:hypothetical protein